MNKRDDFSQKTIDRLCERVGGKCSNPNCRRETKGPHSNPQKRVSIGEAAHITAAAEGGPRYNPDLKDTLMNILLLAMMVPFAATLIPLFKLFSGMGLSSTWIAYVLPTISTPFLIMLFRQSARSFPMEIIEAARIDGLSEFKIFLTIFMPTMKSTYAAALTVTFMNAWNNYLWPKVIMMSDTSQTMPMLVANLSVGYSIDYGVLMLGVLICSLPTGILFLVLQKSFANGIVGAVKG